MAKKMGCLRKDDDGHWYLVPEELLPQFDALLDRLGDSYPDWEDVEDVSEEIYDRFDKYRLGGSPNYLRISMSQLGRL